MIDRLGMLGLGITVLFATTAHGAITCPPDAVPVGTVCVDKYEASVWSVPNPTTSNKSLVGKIKKGTATLGDLVAAGATQLGCDFSPWDHDPFPANFPYTGNWVPILGSSPPTPGVYAVSIPGVLPSACIDWFQSQQACLLSDKRLLTNAEWQAAAAGTPDPDNADDGATTCVTNSSGPADTGSRTSCRSNWGASDMVGNVWEWAAEWVPRSTGCPGWIALPDLMCLAGATDADTGPGGLLRGGSWNSGLDAGVFAVTGGIPPGYDLPFVLDRFGVRCGR